MKNHRSIFGSALLIAYLEIAGSGSRATAASGTRATAADEYMLAPLVSSNTSLAFGLLKKLAAGQPQNNLFLSPFSISELLQAVYNGAAGETEKELERVLGFERGRFNSAVQQLDQSIRSRQKGIVLDLANSLWHYKTLKLNPSFVSTSRDLLQVSIENLDFNDPQSFLAINNWAADHTHGRIQRMIAHPLSKNTGVIVANAIYFKGDWQYRFEKMFTTNQIFKLDKNRTKQIPMMHESGDFLYRNGDGFQTVELPYAQSSLTMLVLLPDFDSSVDKLLLALDAQSWMEKVIGKLEETPGTLALPRFKLDSEMDLKSVFQSLGVKLAFDEKRANFARMSSEHLWIDAMMQKSTAVVNEIGTVAAAVSFAVATRGGGPVRNRPPPFNMVVDRPFIFAIAERTTQSILFIGIIRNPDATGAEPE